MPGKEKKQHILLPVLLFIMIGMPGWVWAEIVGYELTVAQEMVSIAGATAQGMTINGGIPGPTLRFKEGDTAAFLFITACLYRHRFTGMAYWCRRTWTACLTSVSPRLNPVEHLPMNSPSAKAAPIGTTLTRICRSKAVFMGPSLSSHNMETGMRTAIT